MQNTHFTSATDDATPLPEGTLRIVRYGKDGFDMLVTLDRKGTAGDLIAAYAFLQQLESVVFRMASYNSSVDDVERGLRTLSDITAHYTHWRSGPKQLVTAAAHEALRIELNAAIEAKRRLQEDNDKANLGETQ